ncbi:hypothetical protein P872_14310 [Rhodonellum psychrophilum GCM71 = DSM 17998]|uniref:Tryptophan-rich sensory protein n=2 Tax=Rhodonellum TaxID=336827 RepID=U5BW71_9BACT|nr:MULTISPECIES: hypothetical protein [Rhodonellum]ERM80192.1 hypothetical protein P872_14310 [Rhodonellum psychrophilum GCM71 = DSM 17998]SDZ29641.1 hypothetical protein SAMN05444412_109151 [Rhodonellum ikkaensis]
MNQTAAISSKKTFALLVLNTITFFGMLFLNFAAGTGKIGGNSIGEVSDQYNTLISPSGYAFSIWGLIYLMLFGFVAYQWYGFFNNRNLESLEKGSIWFSVSNIANGSWIVAWANIELGLSVMIMAVLLFSLIQLVLKLKLEIWDAPLRIIFFVWWPICIYIGWVILASVLNVAVWLKSVNALDEVISPEFWAVLMISIATMVYLFLIQKRNMREAALVGVWGLLAISHQQWEANQTVVWASLLASGILLLFSGIHAAKNYSTLPFLNLKKN